MGLSHTVSGDIASFRTPSRVPIESLKIHFLPKQEGSGDPSPQNIRNIVGWTGCNLFGSGINLWDEEWELGTFRNDTGEKNPPSNYGIRSKNYIPCKPSTTYYLRHPIQSNDCHLYFYGKNKEYIDNIWKWPGSFTTPSNCYYIRFYMHSIYGTTYLNNIGINYPSSKTSYVKYTGNKEIPISWSDHGVEYGGYIDSVRGKLVATWEVISKPLSQWTHSAPTSRKYYADFAHDMKCVDDGVYSNQKCNIAPFSWSDVENTNPHFFVSRSSSKGRAYLYLPADYDGSQVIQVAAKLVTPIEYDIDPITLKAFLDHNNFWSDANDITEVTYAVTESKDILATRKKAIDFDRAHHKKVKWNNLVNGYLSSDDWEDRDPNDTTTTFENGVSETTFLGTRRSFCTTRSKNQPSVYLSHRYFAYAEFFFDSSFSTIPLSGFEFAGGQYAVTTPVALGDGWYRCRYSVYGGRDGGGYMYMPYLTVSADTVAGQKVKARNVLYIDLTLMFGEGKEPATSDEFLKLCEINGINVHEPHSKDIIGTDQWWIIP